MLTEANTALGIDGYITKDTQTEHGIVYENMLFLGQTVFKTAGASGMTFQNCKFKAENAEPYALIISGDWSSDLYFNFVNCEFEGFSSAAVQPQSNTKYTGCVFHNMGADGGKATSNGGYENCYFYDIGTTDGTHADGIQTTIANKGFYIKNCRFDVVKNGNSGIFFYQEADSKDAVIKDVIINGGNYSVYLGYKYPEKNDCSITGLSVENVKVGSASQYGAFSCNAKKYSYLYDKGYISDQNELFVSSTSYSDGKIKFHVSNYTASERTLVVKTDKVTKEFVIPAHPSHTAAQSLSMSDLPIDLEYEVEGSWITCYDSSESEDNQIRHADYSDGVVTFGYRDKVVIPDKYNTGCDESKLVSKSDWNNTTGLIWRDDVRLDFNNGKCLANITEENSDILIENVDFSEYGPIIMLNASAYTTDSSNYKNFPITITFRNCKMYGLLTTGTFGSDIDIKFVVENCTMNRIGMAKSTVSKCRIGCTTEFRTGNMAKWREFTSGNMTGDPINPGSNFHMKDCYIYDVLDDRTDVGSSSDAHVDGMQSQNVDDIVFENCRWEMPLMNYEYTQGGINVGIFCQGTATNSKFVDCIVNAGSYYYTQIADSESLYFENCYTPPAYLNGIHKNPPETIGSWDWKIFDKLYVSSVTKTDSGLKLCVTNETGESRSLIVVTNNSRKAFVIPTIKQGDSLSNSSTFKDTNIDYEITIDESNIEYIVCYDNSVSKDNQVRYYTLLETDPIVPQTGTWQLKTTSPKNYIIFGTDDDNQGNAKFFRLLRSYGFPYTMNVEAENASSSRMLGTDVDSSIFTDSDAESLFPTSVSVIDFGKYLHDSGLGEVAQHGASDKTLWDSEKLTGDFLTSLYTTYTEGGGTKSQDELKATITEALKDTDGSQDASYVEETRDALKEAFGFPIKTVGIWGGAPSVVIDGVTLDLNSIKNTKNYNWRKHNYTAVCANLVKVFTNYSNPWDMPRIANDVGSVSDIIDTIPAGKACEFFWHAPFSDESDINVWRTLFSHIKELVDSGKTEVITRSKYYELGEFVDNPISSIAVKSSVANVKVGDTVDTSAYTVTATYADGSTADVSKEAIVDASGVNTSQAGKYAVSASYRGFYATVALTVIESINYTVPEGLKNTDYWFVFKDNANNTFYAGNTTGAFGRAYMSSGILAFVDCTAGTMNGWKSSDGQTWEQTDTDETHSKTIKTTSGEKIFDFGLTANDSITWLETSGNYALDYPY